ncbi:amino acid ABC transporter substrate-binding protein [Marinobacterium jannaschii]|uniref:amino acid ABC transporter substrate-binding protein n=1 Tax=Marinobacterium jannaschii TaxID=64970 RepID=UPI00048777BB|nr:amino acid ABC transporter substrate-binding protein [Marinobacterium jannaschii]
MFNKPLLPCLLAMLCSLSSTVAADTLDSVQQRGHLKCGVTTGVPGFSMPNTRGEWNGLDVDLCRAIAAATLGDASKTKFVPLTTKERFTALQSGEVDVLTRNTTWNQTRDSQLGLNFAGINFYDGQGFMVMKDLGVTRLDQMDGATICIQSATTSEQNLADYFRFKEMSYKTVVFETNAQALQGFEARRCDLFTTDTSQLYGHRLTMQAPAEAMILPEIISKEPLGPVVRQGDDRWFRVVKWTHNAMINAEELGVTAANAETMKQSQNPDIRRLLGVEGPRGKGLDLPRDWVYQVITQVGNYGESFERNLGQRSPLKIARGLNALWVDGGLHYAPPIR